MRIGVFPHVREQRNACSSAWETQGWMICQLGDYGLASEGRSTWEMRVSVTDNVINKQ